MTVLMEPFEQTVMRDYGSREICRVYRGESHEISPITLNFGPMTMCITRHEAVRMARVLVDAAKQEVGND